MFHTNLVPDKTTRAKLQWLRDREAERRERIFDDKVRTIGVVKKALNTQVREKQRREEAEKDEQNSSDADMLHNSEVACLLHKREVQERHEMEKAIVDYRRQYQQPWSRREFDLNDPDRCRKTDLSDAQMMIPGLVGEDPDSKGRRRRQQEQLRQWLIQQQRERAAERNQGKLEEQRYEQSRVDMNNKALELQSVEMERRMEATMATKEYNLAKAKAEEKRRQEGKHHDEGNQAGAEGEPTLGTVGVPGFCPSSDRRAPKESLQQIIQFQKYQIEERKRVELEKKIEEQQQHRLHLDSVHSAQITEREQARLRTQLRQNLDSTNIQLSEIRKQQKPDIERGSIDDSFFSKFNTCSR